MNLNELMGHLRCSVLRDDASPYLWQNSELLRFLNQGQKEFCRRTHCLVDDDSDFATFDTVEGQSTYTLDSRIIFVQELGVELDDGEGNLTYYELADRTRNQLRNSYNKGRPMAYNLQVARNKIRFYPTPDKAYTIRMAVARLPERDLQNGQDIPEIPERYHLALTSFAAYMALMNNDPERAQMQSKNEFKAAWDIEVRDAKREFTNLRSGPTPRARTNWTGKRWGTYF
jgi:hypothetical protein